MHNRQRNVIAILVLIVLLIALSAPVAAQAIDQTAVTAAETSLVAIAQTQWAGTPGLDETAPAPAATATGGDAVVDSTTGTAILGWLMGLTAFVIAAIAIVTLGGLYMFFRFGKDRVPAAVFETVKTVATDVTALFKTELDRRYELAKATPTPFDDHLFGAIRDFNETVRLLINAPAVTSEAAARAAGKYGTSTGAVTPPDVMG